MYDWGWKVSAEREIAYNEQQEFLHDFGVSQKSVQEQTLVKPGTACPNIPHLYFWSQAPVWSRCKKSRLVK